MDSRESWYDLILVSMENPARENKARAAKALRRHLGWSLHESVVFLESLDTFPRVIRTGCCGMTLDECRERLGRLTEELEYCGAVVRIDYDNSCKP